MNDTTALHEWIEHFLSDISGQSDFELLDTLFQCHTALRTCAVTEESVRVAFRPLLFMRCVFDFENGAPKRRPPSAIRRALESEAKRGWISFESASGTHGRPSGAARTCAGKWLERVISILTRDMTEQQRERTLDWLLAPGNAWTPGYMCSGADINAGEPSPAQRALSEALGVEMLNSGATDNQIQEKKRQLRKALDNRRRNRRSRPK